MAPNELQKKFNLQPTSTEYKDVLKHFQATCPTNKVLKVCVLFYLSICVLSDRLTEMFFFVSLKLFYLNQTDSAIHCK